MALKKFDCVAMKAEAQRRLRRENAGLGAPEARRRQMQSLLRDPVLGDLTRRTQEALGEAERSAGRAIRDRVRRAG